MDNDRKFQEWNGWLDKIYSDIQQLLINRHIFNEVQEIIRSNPQVQIGSVFYDWMGIVYPSAQVMGVRRQLDNRKDSISLIRLLKEIINCPGVLSRERYLSMYEGSEPPADVPNSEFDRYAGRNGQYIDPIRVGEDLENLKLKAEKIKNFATKRVAHFDHRDFEDLPTFGELDEVLNYLEELLKKYLLLFRSQGGDIVPTFLYDWKKIFRYPWIVPKKELN